MWECSECGWKVKWNLILRGGFVHSLERVCEETGKPFVWLNTHVERPGPLQKRSQILDFDGVDDYILLGGSLTPQEAFVRLCNPARDSVGVYNWALSPKAVKWLYNLQSDPECQRIVWELFKKG